jgi:hypothetical protein
MPFGEKTMSDELSLHLLELLKLYHTEMKESFTLHHMLNEGRTTLTEVENRALEEKIDASVGRKFELAEEQLLAGNSPLSVLRAFLAPHSAACFPAEFQEARHLSSQLYKSFYS